MGYRAQTWEKAVGGCLLLAEDGRRAVAVNYGLSVGQTALLAYDLGSGDGWVGTSGSLAVLGWRIIITPEGRKEGFEVARFPA